VDAFQSGTLPLPFTPPIHNSLIHTSPVHTPPIHTSPITSCCSQLSFTIIPFTPLPFTPLPLKLVVHISRSQLSYKSHLSHSHLSHYNLLFTPPIHSSLIHNSPIHTSPVHPSLDTTCCSQLPFTILPFTPLPFTPLPLKPVVHSSGSQLSHSHLSLPPTLTSARPPTRAWEVERTVVAPPSSVVKCLCGVFVWGFGVLFLLCVRGVVSLLVCVCVCDLLICSHLHRWTLFTVLTRRPVVHSSRSQLSYNSHLSHSHLSH